jgi:threonine synthase
MTATAAAGLRPYVDRATEAFERGWFGNDETVVVMITGNGMKTLSATRSTPRSASASAERSRRSAGH